jgi:adenylate cyclase
MLLLIPCLLQGVMLQGAFGQTREIDSLRTLLQTSLHDTVRIKTLIQLSRRLYFINPSEMEQRAKEAMQLAERNGSERGIAEGLFYIAGSMQVRSRYTEAFDYLTKARGVYEIVQDTVGLGKVMNMLGNIYVDQGKYDEALKHYLQALSLRRNVHDEVGVASTLNNIGVLYKQQDKFSQALDYYKRSLEIQERLQNARGIAGTLNNIGLVYQLQGDYIQAMRYLKQSLVLDKQLGQKNGIAASLNNIGVVYNLLGKRDSAMMFLQQALAIKQTLDDKISMAETLNAMSLVQYSEGQFRKAANYALEALSFARPIQANAVIKMSAERAANAFKALNDFKQALVYQELTTQYRDSLFTQEKEKQIATLEATYQLSQKQVENDALRRDNDGQRRFVGIAALAAILGAVFVLYLLYTNRQKQTVNAELERQQRLLEDQAAEIEMTNSALQEAHERSERLLLNTLPAHIAERLKAGETKIAERFENVSVLFADLAGFTPLAQKVEPAQLVDLLDEIFSAFDAIAERFALEKIKTIGDSYMLVAGVPEARRDHAEAIAMAALAMQNNIAFTTDVIHQMNAKLRLRIGIHTGTVVAGVIGTKKFSYDLWGDTVNIAHRMESHGVAGSIHVSEEFVQRFDVSLHDYNKHNVKRLIAYPQTLRTAPQLLAATATETTSELQATVFPLLFEERGTIEIKGRGAMKTYFLLQQPVVEPPAALSS